MQWFSEEQFEAYRKLDEVTVCGLKISCEAGEAESQQPRVIVMPLPGEEQIADWFRRMKKAIIAPRSLEETHTT